jgi:DNA-binding transcriptional LysR family regulator
MSRRPAFLPMASSTSWKKTIRELRAGHLSIGAAHSVATYVLPGLIEAYRARYPKVKLSVNSAWSGEITGRVMTYDLDLGLIRLLSPKPQGFQHSRWCPLRQTTRCLLVRSAVKR